MKKSTISSTKTLGISIAVLAVAVSVAPLSAFAATDSTTISSAIGSTIGLIQSSHNVDIDATPNSAGVQTTAKDTVTVSSNNSAGYTLKLGESTADDTLKSGSNSIAAASGTFSAPAALTANTWGYRVDGAGSFGAGSTTALSNATIGAVTYAKVAVTASPDTLENTDAVANNDATEVWYSVAVDNDTPSGTYTNEVTYTATTN